MKLSTFTMLLLLACQGVIAQSINFRDTITLRDVDIWAQRKIEEIGITRTKLDSVVLRESICNSLAEVLSQNTTIFIKNYGRGSLATASFRGTASSHTQVTWNGMKLNSPMLGMVDFSLIPSYFIDDMTLLHGAGSIDETGGAIGGAIVLNNKQIQNKETIQLIQGLGSFNTYDTYLRYNYGKEKLSFTTRFYNAYSENDFYFNNIDKKILNLNTDDHNKNGEYRNTHILQEVYYKANNNHHFSFTTWAYQSDKSIPMLTVKWIDEKQSQNFQKDLNIRSVASWKWIKEKFKTLTRVGYSHHDMTYQLENKVTQGSYTAIDSKSTVNNIYTEIDFDYEIAKDFKISTKINYNLFNVDTYEKATRTGYKKYRTEVSPYIALRYKAFGIWGLSYNVRKTINNDISSPYINAFLTDVLIWERYKLVVKSSIVRNYHIPTLNDLYFQPGGNPKLRSEEGVTYDIGLEFQEGQGNNTIKGSLSIYHSDINDWILWLPTFKGYWEPRNIRNVEARGIEAKLNIKKQIGAFQLFSDIVWGKTISTNYGDIKEEGDLSYGKQLVYIPKYSSGIMTKLSWKSYFISHKYNHYSERFTSSSNDNTLRDRLAPYIMNDLTIGNRFITKQGIIDLSFVVNNLFNEEYQSVLRRPMPRANFTILISYKL